jgi:hypothetical protein
MFAFLSEHMTKLLNPKSLGKFHVMDGLPAREKRLRTNRIRSLAVEQPDPDGSVTSDETVITVLGAELFEGGPLENCEGISNDDLPLRHYPTNISQLMRSANDKIALILLTALSVFVLASQYFESLQRHPCEKQERLESDKQAAKPTYGTISDGIDIPTTSTTNTHWIEVISSARCFADPVLERLVPETIESAAATAVFLIFVVAVASNIARIVYAVAMVKSGSSRYRMLYAGHSSTSRVSLLSRSVRTSIAGSVTMQCLLSLVPGAAAAPDPVPTLEKPDFNGQQYLIWHYIRPWVPYAAGSIALIYLLVLYIRPKPASGSKYPKLTANSGIAAAFAWFAVRTAERESWVPILLTLYLCLWVVFIGDSIRSLEFKVDYISYIVLGGGAFCVLTTFLFGPDSWADYWYHYANTAPFILIVASILVYKCWPRRLHDRTSAGSNEIQARAHQAAERGEFLGSQEHVQPMLGRAYRRPQCLHDRAGFQLLSPSPYSGHHEI